MKNNIYNNKLLKEIILQIKNLKGKDISIFDVSDKIKIIHYMIICSVYSDINMNNISFNLKKNFSKSNKPVEGSVLSGWILIDLYDIIIHIFKPETRILFSIDKLWINNKKQ